MEDRIIRATGEVAELRFVLVDATQAANAIGGYHDARAFTRILMGETIVSSLLLASGLKGNGTVQVKFQYSGDFPMATADATPLGLVRAMIPFEDVKRIGDFEPLLSPQTMTVRKRNEQGTALSEGIVEMPSEKIGPCTAYYLLQSEQTRSAVGIMARQTPAGQDPTGQTAKGPNAPGDSLGFCGGFLVEALPKADAKTLAILEQVVKDMPSIETYRAEGGGLDLERMLADLAGPFRYTVHREMKVLPFCPCSETGVLKAISGMPREELEEVVIKHETLELHCEYCRKRYLATPAMIRELLDGMDEEPEADEDEGGDESLDEGKGPDDFPG
ncbi:MAG: Hsp33 family molecular chaperone HslO [Fibrobacteres bacterium]|nr:Hsp33 family molecular chaperone HslO [Fibrobacterota bacterium]